MRLLAVIEDIKPEETQTTEISTEAVEATMVQPEQKLDETIVTEIEEVTGEVEEEFVDAVEGAPEEIPQEEKPIAEVSQVIMETKLAEVEVPHEVEVSGVTTETTEDVTMGIEESVTMETVDVSPEEKTDVALQQTQIEKEGSLHRPKAPSVLLIDTF